MAHLQADLFAGKVIDEWEAAVRLDSERKKLDNYAGPSYPPISCTGPNAALPHYQPAPDNALPLDRATPYLCDSGAQYFDGTIDTTRTVFFVGGGYAPTAEHKRAFTRVLQGHIAIDSAIFPAGSTGSTLDVLARAPMWRDGMLYAHGTGVGSCCFPLGTEKLTVSVRIAWYWQLPERPRGPARFFDLFRRSDCAGAPTARYVHHE